MLRQQGSWSAQRNRFSKPTKLFRPPFPYRKLRGYTHSAVNSCETRSEYTTCTVRWHEIWSVWLVQWAYTACRMMIAFSSHESCLVAMACRSKGRSSCGIASWILSTELSEFWVQASGNPSTWLWIFISGARLNMNMFLAERMSDADHFWIDQTKRELGKSEVIIPWPWLSYAIYLRAVRFHCILSRRLRSLKQIL